MFNSPRRWALGILVGLYLYFLLPATGMIFYELYHLTGVDFVYWGYTAFKAGGYLFGLWEYQLVACVAVGAAIIIVPGLFHRVKKT